MYYTIYETVNLVNGKRYVGKHATKNLNDGYLGSGKVMKKAIKKYGKGNFHKVIHAVFHTEEEMNEVEGLVVDEYIVEDDNFYNLVPGNQGPKLKDYDKRDMSKSGRKPGFKMSEEQKELRRKKYPNRNKPGKFSDEHRANLSKKGKEYAKSREEAGLPYRDKKD